VAVIGEPRVLSEKVAQALNKLLLFDTAGDDGKAIVGALKASIREEPTMMPPLMIRHAGAFEPEAVIHALIGREPRSV
jgi:hypothetical protein